MRLVANNTVLFRPCSYNFNECFHDLVGNVAEFVLDPGSAIRAETELPAESPDKVAAFFQSPQTKLYVIGGSALSPPEFGFDQPLPVTHEQTLNGFSDVGFRLVFTDPAPARGCSSIWPQRSIFSGINRPSEARPRCAVNAWGMVLESPRYRRIHHVVTEGSCT